MSRFWSPGVADIRPYVPGEQPQQENIVKLNTNENPFPPSPLALEAVRREADAALRLYPDPDARAVKEAVARYYDTQPGRIFAGNGSDEVLAHIFYTFFRQSKPILYPDITYSFYPVYCGLYGITSHEIALDADFRISAGDYRRENGGIIFPNPNAPTGILSDSSVIEDIVRHNPDSVVVIDEAYIDFGGTSAIGLTEKYPNLLVCQTLSKSRSLAGLRVGFAVGDAQLIAGLERVKNSFNSYPLGRTAQAGAAAALDDADYFRKTCAAVIENRQLLSMVLRDAGFDVLPSAANFVFATHPGHDAAALHRQLYERRIMVRHFSGSRVSQYLRISVGTREEIAALEAALRQIL